MEAARLLARGELEISHRHDDSSPPVEVDEALAAFGLVLEDEAKPDAGRVFWLWPEHEPVLQIWFAVQTQWRVGAAGATGLDYAGVDALLRLRRLCGGRRRTARLVADLQVMEHATLAEWSRQAQQRDRRRH